MSKRPPIFAFLVCAIVAVGAGAGAFLVSRPPSVTPEASATDPIAVLLSLTKLASLPDSGGEPLSTFSGELPLTPPVQNETTSPTASSAAATRSEAVVLRVPVLMYHYISAVPANQSGNRFAIDLRVPADLFEQHLAYLRDQGFTTISAPALWGALNGRAALPARPVVLTFDDGYADAYTNAFPLLKKYGFNGTFFITVNLIGRPGYLTWDQVRELDAGGMDIESHAMDHRPMSAFSLAGLAYEMGQARTTLAEQVGHEVLFFAYPSGDYNATALQGVAANGYAAAFVKGGGSSQSIDWRYTLRRTRISGYATVEMLKAALRY
ncbi:MAG TPA: polysaccharide deacetylase family protein [Candidatus Limnocylindria bacterium]|nr:polysaccharide deacetylase family protein [Candidatus Limnocylindria bacterium]